MPRSMPRWEPSPRRRRRNQLLLVGLVPSVVATAVALALLLMLARNDAGRAATDGGDHGAARELFSANRWFGTVERWVAPYNEGVASYRAQEYDAALADFASALRDVPVEQECRVLHNLAATREQLADARAGADDRGALDLYRSAREAVSRGRCLELGEGAQAVVERTRLLDERLRAKIEALLERQEREELARLDARQRDRVAEVEAADRRAEKREQRTRDRETASEGDGSEESSGGYGW